MQISIVPDDLKTAFFGVLGLVIFALIIYYGYKANKEQHGKGDSNSSSNSSSSNSAGGDSASQ